MSIREKSWRNCTKNRSSRQNLRAVMCMSYLISDLTQVRRNDNRSSTIAILNCSPTFFRSRYGYVYSTRAYSEEEDSRISISTGHCHCTRHARRIVCQLLILAGGRVTRQRGEFDKPSKLKSYSKQLNTKISSIHFEYWESAWKSINPNELNRKDCLT